MALKCKFKTNFGFEVPEAYVRITEFSGTKDVVVYRVTVHASQEARNMEAMPVYTANYDTPLQNGVLLENLYNHLKTFEMFSTAEDC